MSERSSPYRGHALVTGGTRGIGLGIARALASDGWDLGLCGVRPASEVSGVLQELRNRGVRVHYCQADIADRAARASFVAEATDTCGPIAALVNNAGRAPRVRADLLDASEQSFDDLLRTNLHGPYFLTQLVARQLVERRTGDPAFHGAIVFITSVSARLASTNRGDYCVSKAGLSMAARLFALRLAPHRLPVFEVQPGIIDTDMTAPVREIYTARIADGLVPEDRWGVPADVGSTVAALLRGDLPYATGSVIHVDGGLSLPRL
jgi:3-oxoacyl-[acyl-carrier protein] reductase